MPTPITKQSATVDLPSSFTPPSLTEFFWMDWRNNISADLTEPNIRDGFLSGMRKTLVHAFCNPADTVELRKQRTDFMTGLSLGQTTDRASFGSTIGFRAANMGAWPYLVVHTAKQISLTAIDVIVRAIPNMIDYFFPGKLNKNVRDAFGVVARGLKGLTSLLFIIPDGLCYIAAKASTALIEKYNPHPLSLAGKKNSTDLQEPKDAATPVMPTIGKTSTSKIQEKTTAWVPTDKKTMSSTPRAIPDTRARSTSDSISPKSVSLDAIEIVPHHRRSKSYEITSPAPEASLPGTLSSDSEEVVDRKKRPGGMSG